MKIEHLQALRIKIRKELAYWYDELGHAKLHRKEFDESGYTELEYAYHNTVNMCKAQIKKLVAIQCDIKADIKKELSWQRQVRKATLMKQSAMASVGELF